MRFLCLLLLPFLLSLSELHAQERIQMAMIHHSDSSFKDSAYIQSFLVSVPGLSSEWVSAKRVASDPEILSRFQVAWIHLDSFRNEWTIAFPDAFYANLRNAVDNGMGLLLSGTACHMVVPLRLETLSPQTITKDILDEGYGRMAGFHSYRSHPVFDGLNQGAYVLKPKRDLQVSLTGYFAEALPAAGQVVAVDWDYIFLREDKKVIWEYMPGKGKVLAVGGYLQFEEENINRDHLNRFTYNALRYLAGDQAFKGIPAFYWRYGPAVVQVTEYPDPGLSPDDQSPWPGSREALEITKPGTDAYCQVSGSGMVLMGKEKGGIVESWSPPFMALRDLRTWLLLPGSEPKPLDSLIPTVTIRPSYIERIYQVNQLRLREITVASSDKSAAVLHYEYSGPAGTRLAFTMGSRLRLMWPYSEMVPGEYKAGFLGSSGVWTVRDGSGSYAVYAGCSRKPYARGTGQWNEMLPVTEQAGFFEGRKDTSGIVSAWMGFTLDSSDVLNFVIGAGSKGEEDAFQIFSETHNSPYNLELERRKSVLAPAVPLVTLSTPDALWNDAWKWMQAGMKSFYLDVPGLGKSLAAGHNTTGTGWNGGHKVDGRPGYAWFFGRDAQWSGMALLHCGDFDKVREILYTFQRFQDLNGKIYHELTTSGFAHYDASDATPLYLILAGRYFLHSGDTAVLRELWPSLRKAFDFCLSTDTDGDGLIENTNVGHGWVEGGPLFGTHTSLYLASCWGQALEAMETICLALGFQDSAGKSKHLAGVVKNKINQDFWNESKGHFHQGIKTDGSFHEMPSVMPSVTALFGLMDSTKLQHFIDFTAGNEYATAYGSRILSNLLPLYKPNGYHSGSVWPLFTGWHSLAAWKAGRIELALPLTRANLMIYNDWGYGYSEEVLNGDVYKPSGVCRHQCWSETMALQPVVEGMLGFVPDAPRKTVTLQPCLPEHWDHFKVENLRCGNTRIHAEMEKTGNTIHWFLQCSPDSVQVRFRPVMAKGAKVRCVKVNGLIVKPPILPISGGSFCLDFFLLLSDQVHVEIDYSPGFAVIPTEDDIQPGASPDHLCILKTETQETAVGTLFRLKVQAPSGSFQPLKILLPNRKKYKVTGAEIKGRNGRILELLIPFESSSYRYLEKILTLTP